MIRLQSGNWNGGQIRQGGYVPSAVLVNFVTLGALTGPVVGMLSNILQGEFLANVPYPRMARGWSYEIIFEYDFSWSPHPYFGRALTQRITGISRDHLSNEFGRHISNKKYALDQLPDGLGRFLASTPPKNTSSVYK